MFSETVPELRRCYVRTHTVASSRARLWDIDAGARARSASSIRLGSALDAEDLLERVHDFDQIGLRRHDGVDILVGARCLVQNIGILAALDTGRRHFVICDRELALRLGPAHAPS